MILAPTCTLATKSSGSTNVTTVSDDPHFFGNNNACRVESRFPAPIFIYMWMYICLEGSVHVQDYIVGCVGTGVC